MKSLLTHLGALMLLGVGASLAQAQYPFPVRPLPVYCPAPPLRAPDLCGPGYYLTNYYGQPSGPVFFVHPPFSPFQGMLPIPGCPNSPAAIQVMQARFPSHPYVRSPRDFFMVD